MKDPTKGQIQNATTLATKKRRDGRSKNGATKVGRPRGSLDFMKICRHMAKRDGLNLSELLWGVAKGLIARATIEGDPACARLVLDRFCGVVDPKPGVQVNMQSNMMTIQAAQDNANKGLPMGEALSKYTREFIVVAKEQGLIAEDDEFEDMMS